MCSKHPVTEFGKITKVQKFEVAKWKFSDFRGSQRYYNVHNSVTFAINTTIEKQLMQE